jgi:hypothetical protein
LLVVDVDHIGLTNAILRNIDGESYIICHRACISQGVHLMGVHFMGVRLKGHVLRGYALFIATNFYRFLTW